VGWWWWGEPQVHEGGGKILGVIPAALQPREVSGVMLGETVVVGTMHERKALMAEKADYFIALPGGFGCASSTMAKRRAVLHAAL
jgi:predicted Rossmann-fold nucleotide-binding protein